VARQNFVRLIELVPDDKRAHYYYAGFLNSQRDDVDAEKEYRKVMTMAPDFAPVYNDYAYFLSRLGRYPEAIKSLQKYAELEPREANPHDSMGEIYLYMGDYPNSLKEYQNSLNLNPNFVASYAGLGHNLVFQGKYEDARAKYNDMRVHARSVSDTNMAFYWTSVSYIYEKKYDAAIGTFNDEMSFAQARNNIYLVPEIHFDLAVIYTDKGDLDKALNELALEREAAANQGIDSLSQKGYLRDCLRMEADILARQGKIDMADARLAEYQKAISGLNNPALMRYYHGAAGIIAYYKKDYPTAISELKQSDPQNQYHKYLLGLSYEAAGQNEQAKKAFTEIAKYNHNDLAYSTVRGKATAKM
jgi:tetratricopeptide (TPR) repeat protein